jgi:hypothetical protein
MSQNDTHIQNTGTLSGVDLVGAINGAFASMQTMNSGPAAPENDLSGAPVAGQCWADNSSAGKIVIKQYDGTSWNIIGTLDTVNHVWQAPVGGGVATIASATTTDLGSTEASFITISGTTTITSLGSSSRGGLIKFLTFGGALVLTHNATSLILPTGSNMVTVAGDTAIAVYLGAGNWRILSYQRVGIQNISAIEYVIDGGSAVILTGLKGYLEIPFNCTITRATVLADRAGSIEIDVWKVPYTSFPPGSGNTICGSAKPTLSGAQKAQDSTLSGWTKTITAGDILAFNVDSVSTIQNVTLSLLVSKS